MNWSTPPHKGLLVWSAKGCSWQVHEAKLRAASAPIFSSPLKKAPRAFDLK
jgi:hypothetical protein